MSVALAIDHIGLSGIASVEDAEWLLTALTEQPDFPIEVSALISAHLAIVQLLHAAGRPIIGVPENAFLRDFALAGLLRIEPAKTDTRQL